MTNVTALPMRLVKTGDNNPRSEIGDVGDLAKSITDVGQLSAIMVRPVEEEMTDPAIYEIVYGHRRWKAKGLLGHETIDAVIVELDDAGAKRAALVENAMREAAHPMDEAEAIEALQVAGDTIAQVSTHLGMSKKLIAERRRLLGLHDDGRAAFRGGSLDIKKAVLLARIYDPKMQAKALKAVLAQRDHEDTDADWAIKAVLPVLRDAGFAADDETLGAVACTVCPKRSGNQTELFADSLEDTELCTDSACFGKKSGAAFKLAEVEAKAGKVAILKSKKELEGIFSYHNPTHLQYGAHLIAESKPVAEMYQLGTTSKKTVGEWIETKGEKVTRKLVKRPDGGPLWAVDEASFMKAWKRHKKDEPTTTTESPEDKKWNEIQAKRRAEEKADAKATKAVQAALLAELTEETYETFDRGARNHVLRTLLAALIAEMRPAQARRLIEDREDMKAIHAARIEADEHGYACPSESVREALADLKTGEVGYWLMRASVIILLDDMTDTAKGVSYLAEALGLDLEAIDQDARKAAKPKPKKKPAKSK